MINQRSDGLWLELYGEYFWLEGQGSRIARKNIVLTIEVESQINDKFFKVYVSNIA